MADITIEPFNFPSLSSFASGLLYLPAGDHQAPHPAIISAPAFGAVKEMLCPDFASALAASGFACLIFDYIGFGSSGSPVSGLRQEVAPFDQVQTFRDALTALEGDARINSKELGVLGTSLSGGHALYSAATDRRVKCVVAVTPYISPANGIGQRMKFAPVVTMDLVKRNWAKHRRSSSSSSTSSISSGSSTFSGPVSPTSSTASSFSVPSSGSSFLSNDKDKESDTATTPTKIKAPMMIPTVGPPGSRAVHTEDNIASWTAFAAFDAPSYRNEVTVASLAHMLQYNISPHAEFIRVPTLAIIARDDKVTPAASVRKALGPIKSAVVHEFFGGHFDLLGKEFERVLDLTVDWFTMHLREWKCISDGRF